MIDYIIVAVLVAIVGSASWYVYKSRKSGRKCIGCPNGGSCSGKTACGCGCGGGAEGK